MAPLHYACELTADNIAFNGKNRYGMTEFERQQALKDAQALKVNLPYIG